jgi:hypothetical protein
VRWKKKDDGTRGWAVPARTPPEPPHDEPHEVSHAQPEDRVELHPGEPPGEIDRLPVALLKLLRERHELDALELQVRVERRLHRDGRPEPPVVDDLADEDRHHLEHPCRIAFAVHHVHVHPMM